MATERKCPNCSTWNKDEDYCTNCGTVLSPQIIEELREEAREERRKNKPPTKFDLFLERWKNSKYFLLRVLYHIVYGVSVAFFAIASFFAWLAASPNG
jgi:methionyl-tRNA synthetase